MKRMVELENYHSYVTAEDIFNSSDWLITYRGKKIKNVIAIVFDGRVQND